MNLRCLNVTCLVSKQPVCLSTRTLRWQYCCDCQTENEIVLEPWRADSLVVRGRNDVLGVEMRKVQVHSASASGAQADPREAKRARPEWSNVTFPTPNGQAILLEDSSNPQAPVITFRVEATQLSDNVASFRTTRH